MYALSPDEKHNCPVQTLKLYLSKCDPNAEKLFCQVNKLALENPDYTDTWFTSKPLGQRQFTSFMSDICRNAGLRERYTAHCLRATATQGLDDAGCELRHIMFMTGHRNEASVRSYNRGVHNQTKQKLSNILTNITHGKSLEHGDNSSKGPKPISQAVVPTTPISQAVVPTTPISQEVVPRSNLQRVLQ